MSVEESSLFQELQSRLEVRQKTIWPLEAWFPYSAAVDTAESVVREGWRWQEYAALRPADEGFDWHKSSAVSRSWGYHLHSWEFMLPVLRAHELTGHKRFLDWAQRVAMSWFNASVEQPIPPHSMAWYDMAVALRATMLVELIRLSVPCGSRGVVSGLLRSAERHREVLSDDSAYNSRNNHGFFTAIGQLVLADALLPLPGMAQLAAQGHVRLRHMLNSQFCGDGGHSEHSPEYHWMLAHAFAEAVQHGLITDDRVVGIINKAVEAAGWMVQPDGRLVQLGDTTGDRVVGRELVTWADSSTSFVVSGGRSGHPPKGELFVLPRTGLGFVRTPQVSSDVKLEETSYLAFQAAFHSRAHKHADDLTLVWFDRGKEILVDGGKFGYGQLLPMDSPKRAAGYYYSEPERQYVESTRAHNTVSLNDADHDRRRPPHGSGLKGWRHTSRGFYLEGSSPHGPWSHARRINYRPKHSLFVVDIIAADDVDGMVQCWFNVAGNLDLSVDHKGVIRLSSPDWPLPLWVRQASRAHLLTPVKGSAEPLRGWRSIQDRCLIPCWNFGWETQASEESRFATLFVFADQPPSTDRLEEFEI